MLKASFRIELPERLWIADVSRAFPEATFRLLAADVTENGTVGLGSVVADDPAAVVEAGAAHPAIESVEPLERTADTALVRHESTQQMLERTRELAIPIEFPVVVRDGWYEFDLTGRRADVDRLRAELDRQGLDYELLSIVQRPDGDGGLLTDRQREVLAAAVREGYFEVPRECRLADLAAELDADKATVSEVLRRGQANLVKWFLTGIDGPRP